MTVSLVSFNKQQMGFVRMAVDNQDQSSWEFLSTFLWYFCADNLQEV